MIKFIVATVWICAATLGAVFYAFQSAGAKSTAETPREASMMGGLDYIKTDVMSVPVIRDGHVKGYFLARLVYTVDPKEMSKLTIPADALITDIVYSYIYASPALDFSETGSLDLDAFRNGVREAINARVKQDLVSDVLIEQVDFLTKDEIRDNLTNRKKAAVKVPKLVPEGDKEAHKPAH